MVQDTPNTPPHTDANQKPEPHIPGPHIQPVDTSLLHLFENDADEELICQVNKHPIGSVFIWLTALFIFLVIMVVTFIVLNFSSSVTDQFPAFRTFALLALGLLSFFVLVGGYIADWVYRRSVLIVTSEKLVQLLQRNVLDRKISQLSIGDVQDVTVMQRGVMSRVFNYGTMIVETAGEQQNYTFNFVPYPFEYSQEIVGAHERNLRLYGN